MTDERLEPAMSAEEWAMSWDWDDWPPADKHRCAARCLHHQPFGFTWNDVFDARRRGLHSLADRIYALLPPHPPLSGTPPEAP